MSPDFPKRVVHGGYGKRLQEETHDSVLDFSASVNPFSPQVEWECSPEVLERYPDNGYYSLKEVIARSFHRVPEEICVGNGSIELLRVFCNVVLNRDSAFFLTPPTFGEYELSARLAGALPASCPDRADVFFICNPNNPTGELRKKREVLDCLSSMALHDGTLLCDEAFIDLSDPQESLSDICDPHLFVLQSLTKSFAVPGLRFGYGFGDPDLIEKMETVRPPWSVNAYAEAFALQAFSHVNELERSRFLIAREREWLFEHMQALGVFPQKSSANYLLVDCGQPVAPLCEKLQKTASSYVTALPSGFRPASASPSGHGVKTGSSWRLSPHACRDHGRGLGSRLGLGEKPLILIDHKPMISYVINAFSKAGCEPVVVTSGKTPMTQNWCKAQGINCVSSSGSGFIGDMVEAVRVLDEKNPLFVSVSDIPCVSPKTVRNIRTFYETSGSDACSSWVPVTPSSVPDSFSCVELIDGVEAVPAGVNILCGRKIAETQGEQKILIREPGLAFNVNTRSDRIRAEDF